MTITQSLQLGITKLKASTITDLPHLEAEILLSATLKKPREFIFAHPEHQLTPKQISNFQSQIFKRLKGEPIAYLIGHKEFYGLDFKVNKNVLIPRPETELMVEEALRLTARNPQPVTLIDVGTGSGCIIITLAKQIKNYQLPITNYKFLALDISAKSLAIAKQNALAHNVYKNLKLLKGNLLEPIIKNPQFVIRHSKFVIVSNLPYLTPAQIKSSPLIKYEPRSALAGGPDGLKYYRQLLKQIKQLFDSPKFALNSQIFALLEIDPRQTAKIKQLIKHELPEASCQIKKDLSSLNRLVIIKII